MDVSIASGSAPALEARAVTKRYGPRIVALRDLDLTIELGTTTALVGPNGAGKSTLMKLWMGFERPTAGTLSVVGLDPWRDRERAVARLGYVPQATALYRELTVADHLDLAVSLRRTFDRPYAAERLRRLGIAGDVRAGELSGGQQAQVGLALALGTRAQTLLLDEPLASLDPLARREFLAVVAEVVRTEGTTVLLSSHIVTDVEPACERLIVLGAGRLRLHDTIVALHASHWIGPAGAACPPGAVSVGEFPGPAGEPLRLLRTAGTSDPSDGLGPATLEETVMGYLAADRPSAG
jgi:ABC-2 type transport system ATP-binding protein